MDLTFGQYGYGGLFLRMPYRRASGGQALNSHGQGYPQVEGQPAAWVALSMPIPGREGLAQPVCSIAMLDPPTNPGHPVPWRVDSDLGIAPSRCIAGPWRLAQGECTTSRYRLLLHAGPASAYDLAAAWDHFAATPALP